MRGYGDWCITHTSSDHVRSLFEASQPRNTSQEVRSISYPHERGGGREREGEGGRGGRGREREGEGGQKEVNFSTKSCIILCKDDSLAGGTC